MATKTKTAPAGTPMTLSIPEGTKRTPRPGTMRHVIVGLLAREGEAKGDPGGVTVDELYKMYPSWNKRHVAECTRILREDYGYHIVRNGDRLTLGTEEESKASALSRRSGGGNTVRSAEAPKPQPTGGKTREQKKADKRAARKAKRDAAAAASQPGVGPGTADVTGEEATRQPSGVADEDPQAPSDNPQTGTQSQPNEPADTSGGDDEGGDNE